jgi:hypothetical protein
MVDIIVKIDTTTGIINATNIADGLKIGIFCPLGCHIVIFSIYVMSKVKQIPAA